MLTIPGTEARFTIIVKNLGGGDARNVTLTDTLPSPTAGGLQAVNWTTSTSGCAVSGGVNLTCNIGLLARDPTPAQRESGDEPSVTVTVRAQIPATYLKPTSNPGGPGAVGSRFEIDGNLVADAGAGMRDWGNVGAGLINKLDPPLTSLLPRYTADDAFVDGAKEDDPVPSVEDHEVPPNKSDLSNFLIAQESYEGHAFLVLGWLRTNSLGTANFDFELNQSAVLSSNGVTPVRTTGDVLFSFDFESSGNNVLFDIVANKKARKQG